MNSVKTALPGPQSGKLLALRREYVARGVSNTVPTFAQKASGARIIDVDGNEFIDFAGGIGVVNAGHCPAEVTTAVKEQLDRYIHPCFHVVMYEPYVRLAEQLARITPGNFAKKSMLVNSGAEAVENAVKIARKSSGKTGIIALECAFHGRTLMAMTLTSKVRPYKYGFGPFAPDVYKVPSAYCYRCYFGLKHPECGFQCVENLRRFFVAEYPSDHVAAMIVEPVQGEGGFIVPPPGWLSALSQLLREYDIPLIADEIQTGFGRTGKLFACEHEGVEPELVTMSKSLAAGLPIAAVTGRAEIVDAPDSGELGGTYGGNPLGCAAALAVIDMMERQDLPGRAARIGQVIKEHLLELTGRYPAIGDVRGLGAMVAVELVKDRQTREPDKELAGRLAAECYRRGLVVLTAGVYSNVVRFLVPLVISDLEMSEGLDILDQAFAAV